MTKLLLVLTVSLFSLAITAQEPAEEVHALDVDKDGLISIEEAKQDPALSAIFKELDTNQDGFLSKQELAEMTK
jgi:Ca2+-binding EF-hand superfamily protein